jgi:hypothetical protein
MIVIIRNRGRTFLLARNETGHLHIPRLRLTRLKSRPMIRRCAGGHKKSRWITVAIHKREICGSLQVSPDAGGDLTSRPGHRLVAHLGRLERLALRNTRHLNVLMQVERWLNIALMRLTKTLGRVAPGVISPPPLHEEASETLFDSADLISRGVRFSMDRSGP